MKFKAILSTLLGTICVTLAPALLVSPRVAEAAPDSVEIVFDENPIERGLMFDRQGVRFARVKLGDAEYPSWVAENSIEPTMGWTRSFRFKITDPKFQLGGRPSVDVEITYHMPTGNGWGLTADTKTGGRRVGGGWGNTSNWRTDTIRLDDAYFGARDTKGGAKMSVDGFDLRLDAINSPFFLKSIKVIGSNPAKDVDWKRMLKTGDFQSNAPGGIFAFPRAPKQEINASLVNIARIERPLFYKFDVSDYTDKTRLSSGGQVTLRPDSTQKLPLVFDSSAWPLGPYDGKLSLFLQKTDTEPVYTRTFRIGVVSDAVLPKARAGEFLFGLDAANTYIFDTQSPNALAFYRLMGVDILRDLHRINQEISAQNLAASLQLLAKDNVQGMLMFDPPKDGDANARRGALPGHIARLEEIARQHAGVGPGKIRFFELGNEPDLGFYPGPIPEYAQAFEEMRAAIKRAAAQKGLKPEDTVVMNGGLSFAGPDGERRSREFLQVVDGAKIDAIAYHGHGKGGESEREALERVRDAAKKGGKTLARFIETESGFSGNDRNGLMEQARTAVEKLTYAQSQGLETFMFFRLFMEGEGSEGGYGMTENQQEPRPSVLSYRNMVERLRHHTFVKSVDFARAIDAPGLNAHLFEERDAKGTATGRKTLVAWSERPTQFDLSLRLDARSGQVSGARNFDLWGNASPTKILAGNVASIPVGIEPIFVSWSSKGASSLVDVAPALLTVRADEALLVGATTKIAVLARNPEAKNLNAQLQVKAFSRVPFQATIAPAKLTLRGDGEAVNSQISVSVAPSDAPLALPMWWRAFTDVDAAKITPEILASMPQNVAGTKGAVEGRFVMAREYGSGARLDIARLAGGFGEKRAALLFSTLDAPRDMILPVAASADWYMGWNVNGQSVYSTLDRGNEHGDLADHTFNLPLKKGRNVLSALVLSGSGGWRLDFGGPKERALALTAGTDPDRLEISLVAGGKTLAKQVVPLQLDAPIPRVETVPATLNEWMPLQPLALLGAENVANFFVKEPDQGRWYGGENDLSAPVWVRENGANLVVAVAVKDDRFVGATTPADLQNADSVRLLVRSDTNKTLADVSAGLVNDQALTSGTAGVSAQITRENGALLYVLTMPKTLVGTAPFRLSVAVSDNDSDFLKQKATLGEGKGLRLIAR